MYVPSHPITTLWVSRCCTVVTRIVHTTDVGVIDSLLFGMNYGQHSLVARQQTVCLVIDLCPAC